MLRWRHALRSTWNLVSVEGFDAPAGAVSYSAIGGCSVWVFRGQGGWPQSSSLGPIPKGVSLHTRVCVYASYRWDTCVCTVTCTYVVFGALTSGAVVKGGVLSSKLCFATDLLCGLGHVSWPVCASVSPSVKWTESYDLPLGIILKIK